MKMQREQITVPGQKTGPAAFDEYILDPVSVAPKRLRPAVIVCPGGGYHFCSDREAEPVVMQFLAMGYHSFCLYYSVAPENYFPTSLLEVAKAVAIVRDHSEEWKVDPDQIYVCGFSAGGHLACSLGTFWTRKFVWGALGLTQEQVRPNGLILGYPVILSGEFSHKGSIKNLLGEDGLGMTVEEYFRKKVGWTDPEADAAGCAVDAGTGEKAGDAEKVGTGEKAGCAGNAKDAKDTTKDLSMEAFVSLDGQVSPSTPRTFLWHTFEDGGVPVENSLILAQALRRNGVNVELHIFPKGGHGLSLANEETSVPGGAQVVPAVQEWIPLVHIWISGWTQG